MKIILKISLVFLCALAFANCTNNSKNVTQSTNKSSVTAEGKTVDVYDYDGFAQQFLNHKNDTTYIINFWATWCIPCVKELPYFDAITSTYANHKVKVVLVSLDDVEKIEKRLIPFMINKKLQSQVVLIDEINFNAWIDKVDSNWSGAIPATIIYNKKERKFYERSFNEIELKEALDTFIK